jgi:hypothetical protein
VNAQLQPAPAALVYDEPAEVYHRKVLGEVSNSGLKRALRSPLHYKAWVEDTAPQADTPALIFGRAFHCALLEPARYATAYAVEPDFGDCRFKEAKATRDAWRSAHAGAESISAGDAERIGCMLDAVRAHPWAARAIRDGRSEVTLRWQDEATGLPCKARADYYVDGRARFVLDVKTCQDASPEAFARAIAKYFYHLQHSHYAEGFRSVDLPLRNFLFLAVESEPPHAVALYHIDAEAEARGFALRDRAMAAIAEGLRSGTWPAYSDDIVGLSLPNWAMVD